ncbi:5-methylcytosine restriction system specificity protein McrC [Mesorhizobium sp. BHbdii]
MAGVIELSEALSGRGKAASRQISRTPIKGIEHQIKELPPALIRPDGSLDLYEDVRKLFKPIFSDGKPAIQCGGWVGYIPLNDQYALEVAPRVPIGNLERLIGMAAGYTPRVLQKYTRQFALSQERPDSLFDVLTDQMLHAFDHVWESGLIKAYERRGRIGTSPAGRIDPFESAWRTAKAGLPVAASAAFHRTVDFGPNRLLRLAFEKLLSRYLGTQSQSQRARLLRIRRVLARLEDVALPSRSEMTPQAVTDMVRHLPAQHENYADALMLAQLVISDSGLSIRGNNGMAILPSIIIDMATVFEAYVRRVLADRLQENPRIVVKDGNNAPPGGASTLLLDPIEPGVKNVDVTPDIVIEIDGVVRLVIDAKYKPATSKPVRDDVNQVVLYGAKYAARHVMLLHAGRDPVQAPVTLLGGIGSFSLYNGLIDLDADPIEAEENHLSERVAAILADDLKP